MNLDCLANGIRRQVATLDGRRAVLVGMSGIDASGKGYLAARLRDALGSRGLNVAPLSVDDWLALPTVRFAGPDPAATFYHHGLRLDALFGELVLPLKARRTVDLTAEFLQETASAYHRARVVFRNVDVVLLEGIFLFKRAYQSLFDLALWVDCSFETALERALARGQESLDPAATVDAYRRIYFPAQRLHLDADDPISATRYTIRNDPRLPAGLKRALTTARCHA